MAVSLPIGGSLTANRWQSDCHSLAVTPCDQPQRWARLAGMVVVGPQNLIEIVAVVARRVGQIGEGILEVHGFGHGPGPIDEPWELPFHTAVVDALAERLGWPYLLAIGRLYDEAAAVILELSSPRSSAQQWARLISYLHNAAHTITNAAPPGLGPEPLAFDDLGDIPRLVPFDALAEHVSTTGALALVEIRDKVVHSCEHGLNCPLTPDQLDWLRQLSTGATVVDTANTAGITERTFRRRLSDIYRLLDTGNLTNTLTHARNQRWIT